MHRWECERGRYECVFVCVKRKKKKKEKQKREEKVRCMTSQEGEEIFWEWVVGKKLGRWGTRGSKEKSDLFF